MSYPKGTLRGSLDKFVILAIEGTLIAKMSIEELYFSWIKCPVEVRESEEGQRHWFTPPCIAIQTMTT